MYYFIASVSPWLPLTISMIGLFTSLLVAYTANFKRLKPGVLIGSRIEIYPAGYQTVDEVVFGATGIYIPMTFFNWSPNGESIIDCRITLAKKGSADEVYDIAWYEFSQMLQSERKMGYGGTAQPIPLSPKSSLTRTVLFIWTPMEKKQLLISKGEYELNVYVWTKAVAKPTIREKFEFSVSDLQASDFEANLKNKTSLTIQVSIRETNRDNALLTRNQAEELYK